MTSDTAANAGYILGVIIGVICVVGIPALFGFCLARAFSRQSMGWILGAVFSGIATLAYAGVILVISISGYKTFATRGERAEYDANPPPSTVPQTVLATDGSCQFTIPAGWNVLDEFNDSATVQVKSPDLAAYLISLTEDKEDLDNWTLEQFSESKRDSLSETGSASHSEPTDITVQNWPAKQWITRKTVDGVRFVYLCTCISTKTRFYYVLGWSTNSRFNEAKPTLTEVVSSFKETPQAKPSK